MSEEVAVLEQRLAELEQRQEDLGQQLVVAQKLLTQLKRKELKVGPLRPLSQALAYHHGVSRGHGWDRLARDGEIMEWTAENILHFLTEFRRMRAVVVHYEYIAQCLLGINPSPFADLEEE